MKQVDVAKMCNAMVPMDIFKLDYGLVHTPTVIFRCEWIQQEDNWRNPTYVWDEVGFFTVNFRHRLPLTSEPFIFPSQVTQVFFIENLKKPSWRVVLQKKALSKKRSGRCRRCFHHNYNRPRWVECSNGTTPTSNYCIFDRNYWIVKQRQFVSMYKILKNNTI